MVVSPQYQSAHLVGIHGTMTMKVSPIVVMRVADIQTLDEQHVSHRICWNHVQLDQKQKYPFSGFHRQRDLGVLYLCQGCLMDSSVKNQQAHTVLRPLLGSSRSRNHQKSFSKGKLRPKMWAVNDPVQRAWGKGPSFGNRSWIPAGHTFLCPINVSACAGVSGKSDFSSFLWEFHQALFCLFSASQKPGLSTTF